MAPAVLAINCIGPGMKGLRLITIVHNNCNSKLVLLLHALPVVFRQNLQ